MFANLNQHRVYASSFFACELLTFINVIGQILLMDVFLGGEFTTYGTQVIQYIGMDPEERLDPMSKVGRMIQGLREKVFHNFLLNITYYRCFQR